MKMKAIKLFVIVLTIIPFFVQGCTTDSEEDTTENYVEKARQLANAYGVVFEVTDPNAITQATLNEMEKELKSLKKQFEKPLKLEYVIDDGNSIVFLESNPSLLVESLKTRAEVMEGSCNNFNIKVTIEWSQKDSKFIAEYEVKRYGVEYKATEKSGSCTITDSQDEITIKSKIYIILGGSSGGGYVDMPFEIDGRYDKREKKGSLTIAQK